MAVTITESRTGTVKKVTFDWVSSTGGTATGTTTYPYDGQVVLVATVPSTSAAPTASYTATITDAGGLNVLTTAGSTGWSATATEYTRSTSLGYVSNTALSLTIAAAGDTKAGAVHLWVR